MLFSYGLAKHLLKMLAGISLRDVALARNKYLIVTPDTFYAKIMRSSVLCLYDDMYCNCYGKRYNGPCASFLSLQNTLLIIIS